MMDACKNHKECTGKIFNFDTSLKQQDVYICSPLLQFHDAPLFHIT